MKTRRRRRNDPASHTPSVTFTTTPTGIKYIQQQAAQGVKYKNKTMQQLGELKPWEQQEHNTSEELETVVHQGASFQYSSESLLRVGGRFRPSPEVSEDCGRKRRENIKLTKNKQKMEKCEQG